MAVNMGLAELCSNSSLSLYRCQVLAAGPWPNRSFPMSPLPLCEAGMVKDLAWTEINCQSKYLWYYSQVTKCVTMGCYCPLNQMEASFGLLLLFYFVSLLYFCWERSWSGWPLRSILYIWHVQEWHQNLLLLYCFVGPVFTEKASSLSTEPYGMLHEVWRVQREEESERVGAARWEITKRASEMGCEAGLLLSAWKACGNI